MAARGWALVQFDKKPETRFAKLQGIGFKSRSKQWPASARIVSLHKVRRIYPNAPKYPEFHAFVELSAPSVQELKVAIGFLERFTHVEGYME